MDIRSFVTASCAAGLFAAAASAQSLNIDFGDGAGTPADDYAGAALPGVWNAVTAPPFVVAPLVDLAGSPLDATLVWGGGAYFSATEPAADPPHNPLMDDGVGGAGDVMSLIQFSGLQPGNYEITVYGFNAINPRELTSVILGDFGDFSVIGGEWPGSLIEGVVYTVLQWDVSPSGVLEIGYVGGVWGHDGVVNGIQLRRIVTGDLNGDGSVGVPDLLLLLNMWGPCGECTSGGCPADLDGDCNIGVDDLLILLANWG